MPPSSTKQPTAAPSIAVLGLVLACVFWGIGFPLTKAFALRAQAVAPGASSWFIVAVLMIGRFTASALLLLVIDRRRPTRLECEQGFWLGVVTGVGTAFQTDGMTFTAASTSAFLTQGYVVVLPVVAAIATRRMPALRIVLAVLTTVLGVAILANFSPKTLQLGRGETETLVAAMCFAVQILLLASRRYAGNRTEPITLVFFVTIAIATLPLAAATTQPTYLAALASSPALWWLFAALAVFSTLAPFWLLNRYQPHVQPAEAGVIFGAEPLFASLFALFVPELVTLPGIGAYANETLTQRLLVGGALVTLANIALQLPAWRAQATRS